MKNIIRKLDVKRYFIYHLRWQISAWVMMPIMLFLEKRGLPLWENLMFGQAFGACIFWFVDKWIFTNKKEDKMKLCKVNENEDYTKLKKCELINEINSIDEYLNIIAEEVDLAYELVISDEYKEKDYKEIFNNKMSLIKKFKEFFWRLGNE